MNGIINILKPPGMTSHDVVSFLRKRLNIKKIGHTGTLDPGAAGVLPICIGKATKIVEYITSQDKTYICEVTFGKVTDTFDKYGKIIEEYNNEFELEYNELKKVTDEFVGEIEQTPPTYSAIKINGQRAYELARRGESFAIPSRKVYIYSIDILKVYQKSALLKIHCSKGTYIRSLCNDLGKKVGYGAYMSFLLRTQSGKFTIDNSVLLDDITIENIKKIMLTIDDVLEYPIIKLNENQTKKFLNGAFLEMNLEDKYYRIYSNNETFLGIGIIQKNRLKPDKILI